MDTNHPHATERQATHACGGTILSGTHNGQEYQYCDSCRAFAFGAAQIPSGMDRKANGDAWDSGEDSSPDGEA